MSLREYHKKRRFSRTPEPRGKAKRAKSATGLRYVIQKHAARRLHYDFRLEMDGMLKSWAVPKGPSLDPSQKRLAVAVEDHPLEYGHFEGTIPQGEYGGGTVMLWDQGTWEPEKDPRRGYRAGKLKFNLEGKKLHGGWMLVRKGGRRSASDEKNWFLFKQRDDEADPDDDVLETRSKSVESGRSMEQIAEGQSVWRNGRKTTSGRATRKSSPPRKAATKSKTSRRRTQHGTGVTRLLAQAGATRRSPPNKIEPQLATLVAEAPDGKQWLHEVKYDGYRIICHIDRGRAKLISRNQKDWTDRFAGVAEAAVELPVRQAILDGEIVAMGTDGISRFQLLQNAFRDHQTANLVYFVFDVLYLEGYDLRDLPLAKRKEILAAIVTSTDAGPVRIAESLADRGPEVFKVACEKGLEGIISKRSDRPWRSGRTSDWAKSKCIQEEEFVIGGFTRPRGSRHGFGALLLGYYNRDGELIYAGRVGTGFSDKLLGDMHKQLTKLVRNNSPFKNLSGRTGKARDVKWIAPKLVAQVEFSNWTDEGLLRHPAFLGLREDKPASDVVRDAPAEVPEAAAAPATASRNGKRDGTRQAASTDSQFAGITLTHPDKILYQEAGITKSELANYYETVQEFILPQVVDRPLALKRCPEGAHKGCFFQKHASAGVSSALRRIPIRDKSGTEDYLLVDDLAGLMSLVQMGVLEIHVWGSRSKNIELPDRLVFDLDPDPAVPWPEVIAAAKHIRDRLADLELPSFVKTSGGKGLHLVVPIEPRVEWPRAKQFCRAVAQQLSADEPKRFVATMSKAARRGKIFIDYLRNDRGATSIAAYSTRARPGAPISVPLAWEELSARITSDHFTVRTLPRRLRKLQHDPWDELDAARQDLRPLLRKLDL